MEPLSLHTLRRRARSVAAATFYKTLSRVAYPPVPDEWAPIFLIGCGRSGTTITGTLLSDHRDVLYLNEPRYIWRAVDVRTDVWRPNLDVQTARLTLDAADCTADMARRYRNVFHHRLMLSRQEVLIEKLPVNAFRIPYVRRAFPGARFIVLHRNGFGVARSMARIPSWFGANDGFRWSALQPLARAEGFEQSFLDQCHSDDLAKGLVEWTLSVHRIRRHLGDIVDSRKSELRYEELLADTTDTLSRLEREMGLRADPAWLERTRGRVEQRADEPQAFTQVPIHRLTRELLEAMGYPTNSD